MTEKATYAYGEEICSWLSLKHDKSKPQQISRLNNMKIVQVDYGHDFFAILTDEGQVLACNLKSEWGMNETLRLINRSNDCFKMIACGGEHLFLLRQDNNFDQRTGYSLSSYERMIHIDKPKNFKRIVCGFDHTLSITYKGEIYSWGDNNCGQLGFGDGRDRFGNIQLGLGDGRNRNTTRPVAFPNADLATFQIKDIVAGHQYSLFLFKNGLLWGCGSNSHGELGLGDFNNRSKLTKIPIKNVQQIACSKFHNFSLAYDGSSYYAWGETKSGKWSSPRKLGGHPTSFSAASAMILSSPITFGLTSIIRSFGSHDSISYQSESLLRLFDNRDSYDLEFIIDNKHIKACKCYLKSASEYYRRMFSGNWSENDQVIINDYSYETYYAYLRMLHTGEIQINHQNIAELVDLANCYGDKRLMKHCKTFIWNDLNAQTMPSYLPLIIKYDMKEFYDKLSRITIKQVLPKVADSIRQNNKKSIEFLKWFYDQ
ncbi:RCC1 and BTB domain-containing protein 2 [Dermatophagoides farinae]|uniref:RCC1 and BTB domain-containing protein 2 n=1 Tax=Dermatophagoides farinae TaxID=6954 RepID=UPI003F5F4DB0